MCRLAGLRSHPSRCRVAARVLRGLRRREVPIVLLLLVAGVVPDTVDAQSSVCTEPATMPSVERVFGPVPLPGKWRGKGFGDKRKFDVEITECGQVIEDMVGVRLKHVVPISVDLERDEDDGRYKASYTHAERGMAVVVKWDLEVESESRLVGRMSVMGRSDDVEYELLEPEPGIDMVGCGCAAVRLRREALAAALESPTDEAGELASWRLEPSTCALEEHQPDQTLPTRSSFDAVLRADWEGQLVHQQSCCRQKSEGAAFGEDDRGAGRAAALAAAIAVLDGWLDQTCLDEER